MKTILKVFAVILVIVALGFLGAKKIKQARLADKESKKPKIYPIVVKTYKPKIKQTILTLPYLSLVKNDKDVKLSSKIAARIEYIKPSGSRVKKGDLVVKLDTTNIKSALHSIKEQINATQIALQNLKQTHKRTLDLLKVQGASIEQSQKELTAIANTEAKLNGLLQKEIELKNNLSYATIISPVNGVISKTFASIGSISAPAHPLVAISSKDGFYLLVRVPTDLKIDGVIFDNKFLKATPLNTTFQGLAEYKVYTKKANLISGDRFEVDVVVFRGKGLFLPFDTILNKNGKNYVLIVNKDKAVLKEIHIIQQIHHYLQMTQK